MKKYKTKFNDKNSKKRRKKKEKKIKCKWKRIKTSTKY